MSSLYKIQYLKGILVTIYLLLSFNYGVSQKITFNEHIAPIITQNCTPCHREGTSAPFALKNYEDVAKRAEMIRYVTEIGYMPPWKADPTYSSFANEKILTPQEIALIKQWVDQGMQKGSKKKAKENFQKTDIYSKKPDALLSVHRPYHLKGDGSENFILFIIPFEFPTENNVEGIEYVSSKIQSIHHANYGIYEVDDPAINIYGDTTSINANDIIQHASRYAELTEKLVYYNGWVPGSSPITFVKNIGFRLPKRGVIILTNHYAPSSVDLVEKSSIKLFFTKDVIKRSINTLSIGSGGIGEIKPNLLLWPNEINKFLIQMEVSEPLSLLYVWPHMHLLGKSFTSYFVTEKHDTVNLVRIKNWDFNWQEAYKFKKLMTIPKGSILTIEGVFDNTSKNPNNPYSPPQIIFSDGFMGTKSEMLSLIIVFLRYEAGDENVSIIH